MRQRDRERKSQKKSKKKTKCTGSGEEGERKTLYRFKDSIANISTCPSRPGSVYIKGHGFRLPVLLLVYPEHAVQTNPLALVINQGGQIITLKEQFEIYLLYLIIK